MVDNKDELEHFRLYVCPPSRMGKSLYGDLIRIMNPEVKIVDKTPTGLKGQYEPMIYRDEDFEIYDEVDIDKELEELRVLYLATILQRCKEKLKEGENDDR